MVVEYQLHCAPPVVETTRALGQYRSEAPIWRAWSCATRVSGAGSGALACTNCIGPMPELAATIGAGGGGTACGGGGAVGGDVIPL